MTRNRPIGAWIRPLAALTAVLGMFILGGCGGGSGAPNNPYAPVPTAKPPLVVLPSSISVYPGVPASLTISGGTPPYQAFSANSAVLPVSQSVAAGSIVLAPNPVSTEVGVAITIQDSASQTVVASVTVKPAPLLGALSVLPASADCAPSICSGDTGRATVAAQLPSGGPAAGKSIRFDVIYGGYALLTNNPASPLATTLTVITDATGTATVRVQAQSSASTQPAQIRATAVEGGQQITGNFTITNRVVSTEIRVVPDTATIQMPYASECSSGFRVDYFVYGGTPPYRVSSSVPGAATIVNPTVLASGGYFGAITTGVCADPLVFSIVDASGKQTTATLVNKPGDTTRPEALPPPALAITPETVGFTSSLSCAGKTFQFVLVGGTPPYNVVSSIPGTVISPAVVNKSGGTTVVSNLSDEAGQVVLTAVDSSTPKKSVSASILCSAEVANAPPLLVTPGSIDSLFCTGTTFQFTASGGTPPYSVVSSTFGTGISPATIATSGASTQISGLTTGSGTTTLSFRDASSPQQSQTTTVNCTPAPPPLQVSPASIGGINFDCTDKTFRFVVTGGTPPYDVFSSLAGVNPSPAVISASGGVTTVSGLTKGMGTVTISFVDRNVPKYSTSATIGCP